MITTMCLIWWIPDTGAFGPFVTAHVTPPTTRPTTATAATSDRRRCAENHRNIRRTDRESPRADDIDAPFLSDVPMADCLAPMSGFGKGGASIQLDPGHR